MRVCIVQCSTFAMRNIFSAPDRTRRVSSASHAHQQLQEINTYTLAPLSLLTRGTLAAYHMETEVDFGSWT